MVISESGGGDGGCDSDSNDNDSGDNDNSDHDGSGSRWDDIGNNSGNGNINYVKNLDNGMRMVLLIEFV